MDKWDKRFLDLAKFIAQWSKDPSTKVGAVIVRPNKSICSVGYNGFPIGVNDSKERYENRDIKIQLIQHAEKNALNFATENLNGYTMYTWPFASCSQCAGAIIQRGIKRCVAPKLNPMSDLGKRWNESLKLTKETFEESGVILEEIEL